jgi:hypothetical protein
LWAIIAQGSMLCTNGGGFFISSDIRTKTNISEINLTDALHMLRIITPKQYNFIENINKLEHGFIAQELREILPNCVSKRSDYIPNIFEVANITNKNTITLTNKSTSCFTINDSSVTKIKLIMKDNTEKKTTLKKIIDDKTFIIDDEIDDHTIIFVYGQEVDDFHVLDKNTIFTITTAAVKQLDIELQETKQIVLNQQTDIDNLKQELKELKNLILKN